MGTHEAPARLFYDLDMEAHVPSSDHMLCEIERFLYVGTIRQQLKQYFSHLERHCVLFELVRCGLSQLLLSPVKWQL